MNNPVTVTTVTTVQNLDPLVFKGQFAETEAVPYKMYCRHCKTVLPKGATALRIKRVKKKPSGKKGPTYTFCGVNCQRRDYVEQLCNR